MIFEHSYGVIPLQKIGGRWHVLLICHKVGSFWCFPKGHAEVGESPYKTATRELYEETGLSIAKLLSEETFQEQYTFRSIRGSVQKTVTYYVAEVQGVLALQAHEVADSQWVSLQEAEAKITFPEAQSLIRKVIKISNLF